MDCDDIQGNNRKLNSDIDLRSDICHILENPHHSHRIGTNKHPSDWIPLCRSKLKGRELVLIANRYRKCLDVISLSIDQFARQNTRYFIELRGKTTIRVERMDKINREMMNHYLNLQTYQHSIATCSAALDDSLRKWEGVRKSNKFAGNDDVTFNVYFRIAKNWFDQCKVTLLSEAYWIPMFAVIEDVW